MASNRHQKGLPMRKVTVSKVELLEKLKVNKISHVENYNKALEEYKQVAVAELKNKKKAVAKALADLEAKLEKNPLTTLAVNENLFFDVSPPVSHEADYTEIIQMFEMEVNNNIELDSAEFSQYVMDNWDWKGDLENSRIFYATKQIGVAPR